MNCTKLLAPLRLSVFKIFSVNYSSQHPLRFQDTQNKWREFDDVSKQYQLIYKAPMDTLLKYSNIYLSFSTVAVGGLGLYYAAFMYDERSWDTPVVLGDDVVIADTALECFTYLGAFVAFHIAVKMVLSNYVLRMYQNGDHYIAIYRGHLLQTYKHEFRRNEVQKMKRSLIISWSDAKYKLGSRKGLILENYFRTPEYFNNLTQPKEESSRM